MKKFISVLLVLVSVLLTACAARKTPTPSDVPEKNLADASPSSTPMGEQLVPEVSTTLPESGGPTSTSGSPAGQTSSPDSIVLTDNGKTFNFKVGDSFLLNLGSDVYDWTVTIDNQDVFALKMGVMVIRGAQGIYDALQPGTAVLTAAGDPFCRKASPPCGIPTILFKVTLVVE